MIKLIVSDIDGTLLPTGGRSPSPELVEILTQYLNSGAIIALASGRPLSGLINLFPTLRDRLIYLCCNGSHIARAGETLSVAPLASGKELESLTQVLRDLHYDFMVDTTRETLMESSISEEVHQTIIESGIDVKILPDILKTHLPALKITVSCPGDPIQLASHPRIAQLNSKYTVVVTAEHYFDITSKDVDKGVAVLMLQRQFGIRPEETIVFGDAMNDIPMFLTTPHSYAIENAPEAVRTQAAHIVMGPEHNGVANFLRSILLTGCN